MDTRTKAVSTAIAKMGGVRKVARVLDITEQFVYRWANGSVPVPFERAVEIEKLGGGLVEDIRPDLEWAIEYLRGTKKERK